MRVLRQIIRQLIIEGAVKDIFNELWYNTEEVRSEFPHKHDFDSGTHHRDSLQSLYRNEFDESIVDYFEEKRDLKRLWNKMIDENDLRSFWEGPKMKYFHSLSYYGGAVSGYKGVDALQTDQKNDTELKDLSAYGFFQLYDKSGNKDEMSTYGIYDGMHQIPRTQRKFGVLISGRVTLATSSDAFTESRSKGSKVDIARHAASGMPKRIIPSDDMIHTLLFEEDDIREVGHLGECVIDNWSVDAIVCSDAMSEEFIEAAKTLAKQYGVPFLSPKDLGKKKGRL